MLHTRKVAQVAGNTRKVAQVAEKSHNNQIKHTQVHFFCLKSM